jgi:hypothetical protein
VPFPPFTFVVTFVKEISETKNDPAFSFPRSRQPNKKTHVQAKKSDVTKSETHLKFVVLTTRRVIVFMTARLSVRCLIP